MAHQKNENCYYGVPRFLGCAIILLQYNPHKATYGLYEVLCTVSCRWKKKKRKENPRFHSLGVLTPFREMLENITQESH